MRSVWQYQHRLIASVVSVAEAAVGTTWLVGTACLVIRLKGIFVGRGRLPRLLAQPRPKIPPARRGACRPRTRQTLALSSVAKRGPQRVVVIVLVLLGVVGSVRVLLAWLLAGVHLLGIVLSAIDTSGITSRLSVCTESIQLSTISAASIRGCSASRSLQRR